MKLILIAAVVFLAGCGTLQEACPTLTNPQIEAWRNAAEVDRANGWTYEEELYVAADVCGGDFDCFTCLSAIVDEVYGR